METLKPKSPMQSWLLLCTLAMGLAFAFVLLNALEAAQNARDFMPAYALFWGLYLASYYLCLWRRAAKRWEGWYLLGAVALLFLHSALYQEGVLSLMNVFIIPLVLMLHAVMGAYAFPKDAAWPWVRSYLLGWFICPFSAIDKWFAALGGLVRRKDGDGGAKAARRNVLLGILCGLPVLFIVCGLLFQADMALGRAAESLLNKLPQISFGKLALTLALALLFYSFLYNLAWNRTEEPPRAEGAARPGLPAQSVMAAVCMLLVAYGIFALFQFTYLTGFMGLPEGLTYSEYAVSGFGQLLWVAAINLGVFALGVSRTQPHKALKPLLWCLLGATAVVLLSAFVRLGLYVQAYALTWKRVLSLWLMIYLAATVALCGWRLLGRRGLLRLCALALVGWYVALNLVNVEAMIAQSVFRLADGRGGVLSDADVNYLRYDLSLDAKAAIGKSGYKDRIYYDVEAEHRP